MLLRLDVFTTFYLMRRKSSMAHLPRSVVFTPIIKGGLTVSQEARRGLARGGEEGPPSFLEDSPKFLEDSLNFFKFS